MFENLKEEALKAVTELAETAKLKKGDIFVVGCSTSEVCGDKIGTNSNYDAAAAILEGIYPYLKEKGIFLAAQCCEHLNRSIVIEEECRAKCDAARRDAAAALEAAQREAETQLQQAKAANAAEMETLRQQARSKQDRVVAAILDQLI